MHSDSKEISICLKPVVVAICLGMVCVAFTGYGQNSSKEKRVKIDLPKIWGKDTQAAQKMLGKPSQRSSRKTRKADNPSDGWAKDRDYTTLVYNNVQGFQLVRLSYRADPGKPMHLFSASGVLQTSIPTDEAPRWFGLRVNPMPSNGHGSDNDFGDYTKIRSFESVGLDKQLPSKYLAWVDVIRLKGRDPRNNSEASSLSMGRRSFAPMKIEAGERVLMVGTD